MDFSSFKFDVRIIAGSTLPLNRWAYLEELKQLMQLGVIDDIALLSETDIRNKENIVKRKSMYAQLQGQIQQLSEAAKDKDGTIETLQRQLVQAGIKGKVQDAEMEITRRKEQVKGEITAEANQLKGKADAVVERAKLNVDNQNKQAQQNEQAQNSEMRRVIQNYQKDLQKRTKNS